MARRAIISKYPRPMICAAFYCHLPDTSPLPSPSQLPRHPSKFRVPPSSPRNPSTPSPNICLPRYLALSWGEAKNMTSPAFPVTSRAHTTTTTTIITNTSINTSSSATTTVITSSSCTSFFFVSYYYYFFFFGVVLFGWLVPFFLVLALYCSSLLS